MAADQVQHLHLAINDPGHAVGDHGDDHRFQYLNKTFYLIGGGIIQSCTCPSLAAMWRGERPDGKSLKSTIVAQSNDTMIQ